MSAPGRRGQLIAYCFDSSEGLYREMGRRWRAREVEAILDELVVAEPIKRYVAEQPELLISSLGNNGGAAAGKR